MSKILTVLVALLLLCLFIVPTFAETSDERGLRLSIEADAKGDGFGDAQSTMIMTLKNRHGQTSVRQIRSRTLEVVGDGDKSISIFDNPRDVKGTAFLTYTHKEGDDDQWLYLPALKRVKRISSRNKSGSFMGSEFSYEDIASQEIEKYTYLWLRDESIDGVECSVIERRPVDIKNSGYKRQVVWLGKSELRMRQVEYFDRKDAHLKTLTAGEFKLYAKKFWRPGWMQMINHQNGKSTRLEFADYRFGTGLTDKDFSKSSLKRAR